MEQAAFPVVRSLLKTGQVPEGLDSPDFGPYANTIAFLIQAASAGGAEKVRQVFGDMCRQDPKLAALAAADPEEEPDCRILWAADALQPQPPIEWVIDRLFSAGSVSALVGEPGSKKTYSLIDAGVCVTLGKPWLGLMTRQRTVLFVDEESGPRRFSRRLAETLRAHGAGPATPFAYTCLNGFDLRESGSGTRLEAVLKKTGAGLVLVDSLAMIMPGADENSVKDVQPVMKRMRQIAETTQAAIVIIHHTNRNGGYRGTSAIKGAVDAMIMVESKPEETMVNFHFEKARDIESFKFSANAEWGEGTFSLRPAETPAQTAKFTKPQQYVLRYLKDHGGRALVTDIAANADTCSAASARTAVYSLADKRKIRRCDTGAAGAKATYELME